MKNKPEAFFRIEQANLYRLLLDSDLFDAGDGSQEAVDIVTDEIRAFATNRLECLMGMRSPEDSFIFKSAELPWNDEQVNALTALANKVIAASIPIDNKPSSQPSLKKRGRRPKEAAVTQEDELKSAPRPPVTEPQTAQPVAAKAPSFVDSPERKPFPSQSMWTALNAQEANSNANHTASLTKAGSLLFQRLTE